VVHCRYGPPVHLPQLPTPPRGGAVEVVFRREQPNSTGGTFTRVPASFAGAAFYLVLPAEPRPGILKRGAGSGDPAYNQRVGGARGSFTFWFDLVLPEG